MVRSAAIVDQSAFYDLASLVLLMGFLYWLERRGREHYGGFYILVFTVWYAVGRVIEDVYRSRIVDKVLVANLTASQVTSIVVGLPLDKVRKVLKIAKEPISMETPIGDDEDSHLGDFIEDTSIESPVEAATGTGLQETVRDVLAGLTPREAKVLRMRFGIDMNTDHTLEEVGKQFDVTRERIRQIEARAMSKLRHPSSDTGASSCEGSN